MRNTCYARFLHSHIVFIWPLFFRMLSFRMGNYDKFYFMKFCGLQIIKVLYRAYFQRKLLTRNFRKSIKMRTKKILNFEDFPSVYLVQEFVHLVVDPKNCKNTKHIRTQTPRLMCRIPETNTTKFPARAFSPEIWDLVNVWLRGRVFHWTVVQLYC